MPIEFRCEHCRQRLSAPDRRAGKRVRCPRCREMIVVPPAASAPRPQRPLQVVAGEVPPPPPDRSSGEVLASESSFVIPHPLSDEASVRGDTALEEPPVVSLAAHRRLSVDVIPVSRWVVFTQGVLLAVTAGVFFLAGLWVGRSSGGSVVVRLGPCEVTGQVVAAREGGSRANATNALVMLLPAGFRPESKLDPAAVLDADGIPSDKDPTVRAVRAWGGDYVRSDARGRFRMRVPRGGDYFLLVVSARSKQGMTRPRHRDLAQLGRYFLPAVDLLEGRAYRWTQLRLDGDRALPAIELEDDE